MDKYGAFDYVLTIVDSLTKFVRTIPCNTHITGRESLHLFLDRWVAPYSEPLHLHSDNDVRFTSKTGWWRNVLKGMGIKTTFGTAYRPQSNGLAEVTHRSLEAISR